MATKGKAQGGDGDKSERAERVDKLGPTIEDVPAEDVPATGAEDEIRFFEGSITKIDKDGNEVLSDHVGPGETLRREVTDRYGASKPGADEAEAGDK